MSSITMLSTRGSGKGPKVTERVLEMCVELHGMPQAEADRISLRSLEVLCAGGPQLAGGVSEMDGSLDCLLAPISNTG